MKKIVLIGLSSQSIINFRKTFIRDLINNDFNVFVIAFDDIHASDIKKLGANFICLNDNNRSLNPLKILSLKKRYSKIIKKISPDFVFTFMLKPNIFGVLAAKRLKIKHVFSMVEGLGDVFINNSFKWKFIRFFVCILYKISFRYPEKIFFLNDDDKKEFLNRHLVSENQCEIIKGVGVDISYFTDTPISTKASFLMIARLLRTKGVLEYAEAARRIRKTNSNAIFKLLGNEGTLTINDLQEYIDSGDIIYLGTTNDVRPYLADSTCFILPSYREGLSMSIMEALACGRPVITSNVSGCRDIVIDCYNGYLSKARDVDSLVSCINKILTNKEQTKILGKNARIYAVQNLDSNKINKQLISMIDKHIG